MKKEITNDKAIKNLIKELDFCNPMGFALLRERLVKIADITEKDIENNPKAWENGFVHHSIYLDLCAKIKKHLAFEEVKTPTVVPTNKK